MGDAVWQGDNRPITLESFSNVIAAKGGMMFGKIGCNVYKDMPYRVDYVRYTSSAVDFYLTLSFAQRSNSAYLRKVRKSLGRDIKTYAPITNGSVLKLMLRIKGNSDFPQKFDTMLEAFWQEAKNAGLHTSSNCAVCKQPGVDSYAIHNNPFVPVHASCVQATVGKAIGKVQDNEVNGNYALGFLGAVLGGLVGLIPSLVAGLVFNIISGWLCALVPLAAYYGYKLFKGKMNHAAFASTLMVSIIMIPVMQYMLTVLQAGREYFNIYGTFYFLPLGDYIDAFTRVPEDFLPLLMQVALFIGIGIVIVLGVVRRGNQHAYEEAAFSGNSIRPINPVPQSPTHLS